MSTILPALYITLHSNGLAEKYFQIVKSFFYKDKEEGKDFTGVL